MVKNLMLQIAKLLGVEIGEEFKIRRPDCEVCEKGVYAFFEGEGLMKKNEQGEFDSNSSIEFEDLCLGNYEVVKLPWEPQEGDMYYILNTRALFIESFMWDNGTFDYLAKNMGIIYRTKAEAEAHLEEDYKRLTGKPLGSC